MDNVSKDDKKDKEIIKEDHQIKKGYQPEPSEDSENSNQSEPPGGGTGVSKKE